MSENNQAVAACGNKVAEASETQSAELASATRPLFVRPSYRSSRVEHGWEIDIAMPGVKKKDVSVSWEKDEVTVVGRRSDLVPEGWSPLYEERHKADYRLRLQLNFDADPDAVTAEMRDGVLTLRLPEHESAKPRQIEVR